MTRHAITAILCLIIIQSVAARDNIDDSIIMSIANYPREKIFLQTDQLNYAKGDTVWLRCNLVDGLTGIPSTSPGYPSDRSKFVYVELHDCQADTLMSRYKIKADSSGVFANAIPLPFDINRGYYMLVAYTQWMTNFGSQNFAYKEIAIIGENQSAKPPTRNETQSGLRIHTYPEGGCLLSGHPQNVMFLVTDTDNNPVSARVRLIDKDNGSVITSGHTEYDGLGQLLLTPDPGKTYLVEADDTSSGASGKTVISDIKDSGASLQVKRRKEKIFVNILSSGYEINNLRLVILNNGNISTLTPSRSQIVIDENSIDPGLVSLSLIDKNSLEILSARSFYKK